MKDILLTQDGDLVINETGDISLTDSVRQAIRVRLRWFLDEWRLGPEIGVPYYDEVFVKSPNSLRIQQLIRDEILTVDEVTDVQDVTFKMDAKSRTAAIKYIVSVGEETFREEVLINA